MEEALVAEKLPEYCICDAANEYEQCMPMLGSDVTRRKHCRLVLFSIVG
jgi:hypothetical protein